MKQRIAALILALGLTAGLAACRPQDPRPRRRDSLSLPRHHRGCLSHP